ncbi:MAG: hypothetical protein IPF83_12840 [Rhodanobacteraceae bacterium]|nr:hypothetical protein [Rhodanobacteraceae bacterium]
MKQIAQITICKAVYIVIVANQIHMRRTKKQSGHRIDDILKRIAVVKLVWRDCTRPIAECPRHTASRWWFDCFDTIRCSAQNRAEVRNNESRVKLLQHVDDGQRVNQRCNAMRVAIFTDQAPERLPEIWAKILEEAEAACHWQVLDRDSKRRRVPAAVRNDLRIENEP